MLPKSYDLHLVARSYVVAVAGSYTTASLAGQLTDASGRLRVPWLLGLTFVQATAIWSMHFLGMLALQLPVRVAYDLPLTVLSYLIAAAGVAAAAFVFANQLNPRHPVRTWRMIAAGAFFGLAIVGLHYTDMAAMRVAARLHHSLPWVAVSMGIAIGVGILAMWLVRQYFRTEAGRTLWRKWAAALISGVAVVGQHYTAMAGAWFTPGPDTRPLSQAGLLRGRNLPETVLLATLAVLLTALVSVWIDRRRAMRAAISRRLLASQENQRRGIARVLHEDVGQLLTALRLNLQRLHPLQGEAGIVGDSITLVDDALTRVRALSIELRPSVLDDLGLAAAVTWYANRQAERAGYTVKVIENLGRKRLDEAVETAAFRIVQQALTNVTRHAQSKNVRVSLRLTPRVLDLTISDDGVGFNVGAARIRAMAGESLGLLDMKELATLADAIYSITSVPGKGSTIHVRFALPAE
jgi:NO-binding membrane sensor protein with MHYT domain/anti-sigma regulatory factor (Ser/Thr protein kinase)